MNNLLFLGVVFKYDSMYVPFWEWLGRNFIDVNEGIVVHSLTLADQIWYARN